MSQILDWKPAGGVAAVVLREGRRLMMLATSNPIDSVWMVVALESAESADSLEQVFEQHAHASVAENVTLDKALEVAQAYADAWLAGDAEAMERCKCKEILPEDTILPLPPELFEGRMDTDSLMLRQAPPSESMLEAAEEERGPEHALDTSGELESLSPFHQHLEVCAQCREHPFALCTKGAIALRAEVEG